MAGANLLDDRCGGQNKKQCFVLEPSESDVVWSTLLLLRVPFSPVGVIDSGNDQYIQSVLSSNEQSAQWLGLDKHVPRQVKRLSTMRLYVTIPHPFDGEREQKNNRKGSHMSI